MSFCPLCDQKNNILLERVNTIELVNQYKALTGKNFGKLFDGEMTYNECNNCGLKFFDPKITGDEEFYNSLQRFAWYYLDDKDEYTIAKEYVQSGDLVLDVGCGKGKFANHVYRRNARFLGLDFSSNAKAMAAADGIAINNQSIQQYANENPGSVDVVTSFQVCEHVSDVKSFLEAKLAVLKNGGRMIIAVPSEESYLSVLPNGILNMPPHHITRWTDKVFAFIATKYDLQLEHIIHEKTQDYHARMYLSILFQNAILRPKLLDGTLIRKFVTKASHVFSKLLVKGLTPSMRPNGHTVLAVFRKK